MEFSLKRKFYVFRIVCSVIAFEFRMNLFQYKISLYDALEYNTNTYFVRYFVCFHYNGNIYHNFEL